MRQPISMAVALALLCTTVWTAGCGEEESAPASSQNSGQIASGPDVLEPAPGDSEEQQVKPPPAEGGLTKDGEIVVGTIDAVVESFRSDPVAFAEAHAETEFRLDGVVTAFEEAADGQTWTATMATKHDHLVECIFARFQNRKGVNLKPGDAIRVLGMVDAMVPSIVEKDDPLRFILCKLQ